MLFIYTCKRLPASRFLWFFSFLLLACSSTPSPPVNREGARGEQTEDPSFQNGDIIFHTSQSTQSKAIQLVTNSVYSHMGIIYWEKGQAYVYEAVQPVKLTKLSDWIARGEGGHYVVKRWKRRADYFSSAGLQRLKSVGERFLGKDYDLQFAWSDDRIYCSELVWKMYKESFDVEIGALEQFRDFDFSDPLVQKKIKERFGRNLPMDEWVITPDRCFAPPS